MRVNVLIRLAFLIEARALLHAIVTPELPIERRPHLFESFGCHPGPRRREVVAIPEKQVRESRGHPKVGDQQLHDPCASVERQTLFCEECRVDLEVVIEDQ